MLWINVVWLVGLTSITGGILVLVWYFVGLILEKLGFANIVFELLKMVVFFFLMPIAYIGLKLYIAQSDSGYLFSPTPAIVEVCRTIGMIWLAGAIVVFLCVIRDYSKQKKLASTAFECPRDTVEFFQKLKLEVLGKDERLKIQQLSVYNALCGAASRTKDSVAGSEVYTGRVAGDIGSRDDSLQAEGFAS